MPITYHRRSPEQPKRSFGQEILGTMQQASEKYESLQKGNQQKEASKRLGLDPDLSPELQKLILQEQLRGGNEEKKQKAKYSEMLNFAKQLGLVEGNQEQEGEKPQQFDQSGMEEMVGEENQTPPRGKNKQPIPSKNKKQPPHSADKIAKAALVNPTWANNMQKQNQDFNRQQQHQDNLERQDLQFHHKETGKFAASLADQANSAQKKNRALERQMKDVDKIGFWDKLVTNVLGGTPWENILKSNTAQAFDSNTLPQLEGLRQTLGGVLSDSDIRLLMQKVVTASKSPDANKYIADWLKNENNLVIEKDKISNEIMAENGGYRPANYLQELDSRMNERFGDMIQSQYQQLMELPDDPKQLSKMRRKVPPGTTPSDDVIRQYLKMANNDQNLVIQLLTEDNYNVD